jgi:hypothetical protein
VLWDRVGPGATFVTAAVLAALSMLLLMLAPRSMFVQ